jgi:hypothetical protein
MFRKVIGILIVVTLLSTSISFVNASERYNYKILVRIQKTQENIALPEDATVVGESFDWVDVVIDKSDQTIITGLNYEVLIGDVVTYDNSVRGSYHTLDQVYQILSDIASNYPSITNLYDIGTSYEGRDIKCLEITDNPGVDEGEPGVLYMGLHHAREWPTVEICLNISDQLTSNYGSDSTITNLVNTRRIWIVTVVNPDGYYYSHDIGIDWRKNRHYFPEWDTYGVDLNRNYGGSNNGNIFGFWGSVRSGAASHHPTSEVFCGPGPLSEYESQAVQNMFENNDICAAISYHTHGELVLWPWNHDTTTTPDNSYLSQVGQNIAAEITQQDGSGTYFPEQGVGLYPTTGDTTDWVYGYSHYVLGKTTFIYTIEACTSFHPSESYLDQIVQENFDGALYLLEEAGDIHDVIPRVLPPVIDEMTDEEDSYNVSWVEQNIDANPSKFQLDELTDLTVVQDDAETTNSLWNFDWFSRTEGRANSGSYSYKSHYQNNDVSNMVTKYPVPISSVDKLSFYCWYDIEEDYDMAMVEISRNGKSFEILDTFTGSSSGWDYKEYDLNDYAGESIFIQFRYATDEGTLETGFFVDDISPVADFGTVTTLSDSITTNYYTVNNQAQGVYYYRVKGYNSAKEWGDFSTLEDVVVLEGENLPPNTPSNPSPINGQLHVEIDADLSWTGGDPNHGDTVYYDVYFEKGDSSPDELVSEDQTQRTYDPGELDYETKYYWRIISTDDEGLTTEGPVWSFTTKAMPNLPPYEPSNPNPEDNAVDVPVTTDLSWDGGDPNVEDTVTYDIYFGTDPILEPIFLGYTDTTYNLGTLEYGRKYYWKIVSEDNTGLITEGSVWTFTTKESNTPPDPPIISGESGGKPRNTYDYTFIVNDYENDHFSLWIEWGDGSNTGWRGPYEPDQEVVVPHSWPQKGMYIIKAKAKDTHGDESEWGYLEVAMPKVKTFRFRILELLQDLINRFPILQRLFDF